MIYAMSLYTAHDQYIRPAFSMDVKVSNEKKIEYSIFFSFSSKDDNSKEALNLLFL